MKFWLQGLIASTNDPIPKIAPIPYNKDAVVNNRGSQVNSTKLSLTQKSATHLKDNKIALLPIEILIRVFQFVLISLADKTLDKQEINNTNEEILNNLGRVNKQFYKAANITRGGLVIFKKNKIHIPNYKNADDSIYHAFSEAIAVKCALLAHIKENSKPITSVLFYLAVRLTKFLPVKDNHIFKNYYPQLVTFCANIIYHCNYTNIPPTHSHLGDLLIALNTQNIALLMEKNIISLNRLQQFIETVDFKLSNGSGLNLVTAKKLLSFLDASCEKVKNNPDIIQQITEHLKPLIEHGTDIPLISLSMKEFIKKLPITKPASKNETLCI